jgi:hypothetical protein
MVWGFVLHNSMRYWVLEHLIRDHQRSGSHEGPIYEADQETMKKVLAVQRKGGREVRLRSATEQDWREDRPVVPLDPSCRDWTLRYQSAGHGSSRVLRHTSWAELLQKAEEMLSDQHFLGDTVHFHPATAKEIAKSAAEQAKWEAHMVEQQRSIVRRITLAFRIVFTIIFCWVALVLDENHRLIATILFLLAAVPWSLPW